jgi:hypothetical protein
MVKECKINANNRKPCENKTNPLIEMNINLLLMPLLQEWKIVIFSHLSPYISLSLAEITSRTKFLDPGVHKFCNLTSFLIQVFKQILLVLKKQEYN